MSPLSKSFSALAIFTGGLAAGWFGRGLRPSADASSSQSMVVQADKSAPATPRKSVAPMPTNSKEGTSQSIRQKANRLLRSTGLMDGLNKETLDFLTQTSELTAAETAELIKEFMEARNNPDTEEASNVVLGALLIRLADGDPKFAATWLLANMPGAMDELIVKNTWIAIAEKDPNVVLELLASTKDPDQKRALNVIYISAMAKTNPEQAMKELFAQVQAHPDDSGLYQEVSSRLAEEIGKKDPKSGAEAMLKMLANVPNIEGYEQLSKSMAAWLKSDPAASLAWALQQDGDGSVYASLARLEAASNGEKQDPKELQQTADAMLHWGGIKQKSGELTTLTQLVVSSLWEQSGLDAARTWMEQLPDPKAKEAAHSALVGRWLEDDPVAASQWLDRQPNSPAKESGIEALVETIRPTDPERSFAWASKLQSEDARNTAMQTSMRAWLSTDPIAAARALEKMSPDFREAVKTPAEDQ